MVRYHTVVTVSINNIQKVFVCGMHVLLGSIDFWSHRLFRDVSQKYPILSQFSIELL